MQLPFTFSGDEVTRRSNLSRVIISIIIIVRQYAYYNVLTIGAVQKLIQKRN